MCAGFRFARACAAGYAHTGDRMIFLFLFVVKMANFNSRFYELLSGLSKQVIIFKPRRKKNCPRGLRTTNAQTSLRIRAD